MKFIESNHNSQFKILKKLISRSGVKKNKNFLVEGQENIINCIDCGFKLTKLYICSEIFDITKNEIKEKVDIIDLSKTLFKKISKQKQVDGIIALFQKKDHDLKSLNLPENAFIIVLESTEKPGNIGAVFRTAVAAGVDAVIISNPKTEIYNQNVIRNSIGSVFSLQTALATNYETIKFLKDKKIKIISTLIKDSVDFRSIDYQGAISIIIGPEESSLSKEWIRASNNKIKIPMKGKMNSLNLSVSAAIVIFEAIKKRN